jgi:hypothetical protein
MRRALLAILCGACTTPHLTKFRGGINDCIGVTQENGAIFCKGKPVATVECFLPRQETCAALAVRYPDGERVFLYQPPAFDPTHPENAASDVDHFAQRPEIADDATFIWFKRSEADRGNWEAYEMDTGAVYQIDSRGVVDQKARHGSRPLWTLPAAAPTEAKP